MKRKLALALLALACPALGGCALQAAMAAAELLPEIPAATGPSNAQLRPTAIQLCTSRAQQYGTVYVMDVEQARVDRIVVAGSVIDAQQQRRTFECQFTTKIAAFKVGEVLPPSS